MFTKQPNRSVQNGLACLEAVSRADAPVGSRELARQLDLGHATVSRLLNTLAELNYLSKTENRKFTPGPGLHVLTAQSMNNSHLLRCSLPTLRELGELHRYRVALGTLWRGLVSYMYFQFEDRNFQTGLMGHRTFPAHDSSIGRVLMAHRPPLPDGETYPDSMSIPAAEAEKIRAQGYAFVDNVNSYQSLSRSLGHPPTAALALSVHSDAGVSRREMEEKTAWAVAQIEATLRLPRDRVPTLIDQISL
jgi:DNA-binding IclR family transcriptional regulator